MAGLVKVTRRIASEGENAPATREKRASRTLYVIDASQRAVGQNIECNIAMIAEINMMSKFRKDMIGPGTHIS